MSGVSLIGRIVRSAAAIGCRALRYLAAAFTAARARLHVGGTVPGLVSVVVPVHEVEPYIDDCLRSLRRQSYRNVEIIVVDDGSPDGSMRIVERHRRRDPRVRIVRRPNGGPGAARNTGVRAARGEFLTFLDPDDLVRADGYRLAVAALRESGSDFVVLNYDRLDRGRRRKPGHWISAAHAIRRLRCTVESAPDIQVNAVVWSKVFRRSFYEGAGLQFPEGVIYEDQPVSARAYARARSFDVLPDVLVSWRVREDGTSLSQQTATVANMAAHNDAVRVSLAELAHAGHPDAATARAVQLLANTMRFFTRHAGKADDEFWDLLRIGIRELMDRVPRADYIREVPAQDKVLNLFVMRGDRERTTAFLAAGGLQLTEFPTRAIPEGVVVELPFHGDAAADVPADNFLLADRQLSLNSAGSDPLGGPGRGD